MTELAPGALSTISQVPFRFVLGHFAGPWGQKLKSQEVKVCREGEANWNHSEELLEVLEIEADSTSSPQEVV